MSKILIAEDNPVSRELLREMLSVTPHQVVEARDGREALTKMAEFDPDVVLLDINMPVLDGLGVIHEIRGDPRFSRRPVMAITAFAMKEDRDRILAAGFDAYMSKPIEMSALLDEVERLVEIGAARDAVHSDRVDRDRFRSGT